VLSPDWILFLFAALLSLGWSLVNGMHRRSLSRKQEILSAVERFPPKTGRKLVRLMAPTRLKDRINHATVIAGCCTIICTPIFVVVMILGILPWWQPPLLVIAGTLAGAYVGELVFNSWGCGLDLPEQSIDRQSDDEPEGRTASQQP